MVVANSVALKRDREAALAVDIAKHLIALSYAETRSRIAKKIGLGNKRGQRRS